MSFFYKNRTRRPGGMTYPTPRGQSPLTEGDMQSFIAATEQRTNGTVPSIFDLAACLDALEREHPIEVRSTRRQLRWLMKASRQSLGSSWEHPWQ